MQSDRPAICNRIDYGCRPMVGHFCDQIGSARDGLCCDWIDPRAVIDLRDLLVMGSEGAWNRMVRSDRPAICDRIDQLRMPKSTRGVGSIWTHPSGPIRPKNYQRKK